METFKMIRVQDESGISGTGHVLDGVVFSTGQVVICWLLRPNMPSSIGVYENWEDFEYIHINSHPTNDTRIVWCREGAHIEQKADIVTGTIVEVHWGREK